MFTAIYTAWLRLWEIFPSIFNMLMTPIPKDFFKFINRIPLLPNTINFIYNFFGLTNRFGVDMLWFDFLIALGILIVIEVALFKIINDMLMGLIKTIGAIWDLIPFA